MIRRLIFLLLISYSAIGQGKKIPLDKLPNLDTVWTPFEYNNVLPELYAAKAKGIPLPRLDDKYYSKFFTRLISKDNLSVFTNQTLTPDERFQIVFPYFEILPVYIDLFTEAGLINESIIMGQFIMETTVQMTLLSKDKLKCASESRKKAYYKSQQDGQAVFMVINGGLEFLLPDNSKEKANPKYLIELSNWCLKNIPSLMEWMTLPDQEACRTRIEEISKNHYLSDVKSITKELLKNIDNYKQKSETKFSEIILSSETSNNKFINKFLNIELPIPNEWTVNSREKINELTENGQLLSNGDISQYEKENSDYLLLVSKMDAKNTYNSSLLLGLENIECSGVKTGSEYLQQLIEQLNQTKLGYQNDKPTTDIIDGQEFSTVTTQLGKIKQVHSVIIVQKKFALVYTLSFMEDNDGRQLKEMRDSTKLQNAR